MTNEESALWNMVACGVATSYATNGGDGRVHGEHAAKAAVAVIEARRAFEAKEGATFVPLSDELKAKARGEEWPKKMTTQIGPPGPGPRPDLSSD